MTGEFVDSLYSAIIKAGTFLTPSIKVAEAAKVIENTQRDVNIALINELAIIFDRLNIDTKEVLDAASTKWNFLNFKPGLVGGHCAGVDPFYLTHKALEVGYNPEIILAGRRINDRMGHFIVKKTMTELKNRGINSKNVKVAILGLTFKENCPDLRNSKVKDIYDIMKKKKLEVSISDCYADEDMVLSEYGDYLRPLSELKNQDVVLIAVRHTTYTKLKLSDFRSMMNEKGLVVDVKSIFSNEFFKGTEINYWRL